MLLNDTLSLKQLFEKALTSTPTHTFGVQQGLWVRSSWTTSVHDFPNVLDWIYKKSHQTHKSCGKFVEFFINPNDFGFGILTCATSRCLCKTFLLPLPGKLADLVSVNTHLYTRINTCVYIHPPVAVPLFYHSSRLTGRNFSLWVGLSHLQRVTATWFWGCNVLPCLFPKISQVPIVSKSWTYLPSFTGTAIRTVHLENTCVCLF